MDFVGSLPEQLGPSSLVYRRNDGFKLFTIEGVVSLVGKPSSKKTGRIQGHTGQPSRFLLTNVMPLSSATFPGSYSAAQGISEFH